MVAGNKKSRTTKRMNVRVPSGKSVVKYKAEKPAIAKCQLTGQKLNGVPRASKKELQHMSKSQKRPSRPFGGALSPAAMKRVLISRVRE